MLVIASIPWSSTFLSMMSTRSSRALHALARARMSSSSASAPTDRPKWSRRGQRHRRVVGDEEHELLDVCTESTELLAVDGHHRQLVPTRTRRRRSRTSRLAVLLVEQVGRQAHRDVVEPRLAGCVGRVLIVSPPSLVGTIMTLAASSPSSRPLDRVEQPVERRVLRLDEQVVAGSRVDASSSSARSKPSAS